MPRSTQPQSPDQLYARVIFTADEFVALTPDELVLLDDDLLAALDSNRELGWNFNVEDVTAVTEMNTDGSVVVSKSVRAYPFGMVEL